MRKIYFSMAMAATLALGACSSDDIQQNATAGWSEKGDAYLNLTINLPSQSGKGGFKAVNDNFDDGLAAEYKVNNAILMIFNGTSEADAVFASAYTLPVNMQGETPANNQVTSTMRIVNKLNSSSANKVYAYVVLNHNSLFTVTQNNGLTVNSVDMAGKTLSQLGTVTNSTVSAFTGNGFLMLNAPLATAAGGATQPTGVQVQTLVDVSSNIYPTEAEAQSKPAASIYVERAVGKVTVTNSADGTLGSTVEGLANRTFSIEGWGLNVTNKSSYIARNVDGIDWTLGSENAQPNVRYRFVGSDALKLSQENTEVTTNLYRTYWGKDLNYEGTVTADAFNIFTDAAAMTFSAIGDANPLYCFENTFVVANQNIDQTTQAVVKVKLNNGAPFYVVNNDRTKVYGSYEGFYKSAVLENADVQSWVSTNVPAGEVVDGDDVTVTATRNANTGVMTLTSFTVTYGDKTYTADASNNTAVLNSVAGAYTITAYADGMAYYPVRIKHFGNDLTPWGSYGETAGNVYDNNNASKYLGRYGVLRNNWYNIEITGISGIGEPTVPSIQGDGDPNTPDTDDNLYNYIAVRINVLSWAKRNQSVIL